jgi:flagellar assembly protein FliH
MSSKLHPGGLPDAVPMAFRSVSGIAPAPPRQKTAGAASPQASSTDPELQAAYQKGVAAGEASGAQKAAAQLAPVLQNFAGIVHELASARQRARAEAEESMVQLSIAIARRILNREIATDPEAILGLVRSALDRVSARETHRIRLSPPDAHVVTQHRASLNLPPSVEITGDPSLPAGSAIFETSRGELDASAHTQLEEIQRGFTDLVARRRS